MGVLWSCEGLPYKYITAHRRSECSCSFGAVIASDVDVPAARAAGSQLVTYTELDVYCSAAAAPQCIAGQRANRDHGYLSDLSSNVKNKRAQEDSESCVLLPFLPAHHSLQWFFSYLVSFSKLGSDVLHYCLGVTRILILSKS